MISVALSKLKYSINLPVKNEGGHIRESSGGKASSLVWPRDLPPPTELVESDLEKTIVVKSV